MLIEYKACPRCGNAQTVRLRPALSMYWNCRLQWARAADTGSTPSDTQAYPFSAPELRRLADYRAAVIAGLYTDGLAPYEIVHTSGGRG